MEALNPLKELKFNGIIASPTCIYKTLQAAVLPQPVVLPPVPLYDRNGHVGDLYHLLLQVVAVLLERVDVAEDVRGAVAVVVVLQEGLLEASLAADLRGVVVVVAVDGVDDYTKTD